jgi:hypothetical protein
MGNFDSVLFKFSWLTVPLSSPRRLVVKIKKPHIDDVGNVKAYRNRKNCWGLIVFAGCDHRTKFLMLSAQCSGSTNDCVAWELTSLASYIRSGSFNSHYSIVCDEALSCTEVILTPYGGQRLGIAKDSFNYHLSAMRQTIERAFGILVARWGIFWRPLQCAFDRQPLVINVAAKLHNLCIDFKVPFDGGVYEDYAEGDKPSEVFTNCFHVDEPVLGPRNTAHDSSLKRTLFTTHLANNGWVRPARCQNNSRA